MTRDEHDRMRSDVRGSLMADDGRETHRNVYPLRRKAPVDEVAVRAQLYAMPRTRVSNVVPFRPVPEPPILPAA